MGWKYAISAGLLVAAMLGGLGYFILSDRGDQRFAHCRETAIAGALGGPFELVDHTGRSVTDRDVITRPTLIYFGYTFCPDVCPWDAARNAQVSEILAARGFETQPVFITIDPERDTPEVLARFAGNLSERMIGLTGTLEQVRTASQAYRTYFRRHDSTDDFYLVDHSTFSYLALPGHGVVEIYRRTQTAEEIAESMACFIEAS
jgi:protein SCO1/2